MQNKDREPLFCVPLFCVQFAKQKVCLILYFFVFKRFLRQNINQIRGNIDQILPVLFFNQLMFVWLS